MTDEPLPRADEPLSAASMPPPKPTAGESRLTFLKDNLEAIAIAFVMALVIKHFCVEAFKIPTSSMLPTLFGDGDAPNDFESAGDRILVDKWAYVLSGPERWDVVVFRYPLNRARNFIKRVAGLPDEQLRISDDGDLWVRPLPSDGEQPEPFGIARKPRRVREQLYAPVYPPPPFDVENEGVWTPDLSRFWRAGDGPPNAWRLEDHARFVFTGGRHAEIRNSHEIKDGSTPTVWATRDNPGETVRDARFRARVIVEDPADAAQTAGATRLSLAWDPDGEVQAVLALSTDAGESRAFVRRGTTLVQEERLEYALAPGGEVSVEMEYVDGDLRIHLDGDEVAVIPDGRVIADTHARAYSGDQRFTISAEGGPLRVEALRIDRDICHGNDWTGNPGARRNGVRIPPDSYLMLGDNTNNSSDSRRWQITKVHLLDGSVIRHEKGAAEDLDWSSEERSRTQVVDADGITRTWYDEDLDPHLGSHHEPAPFVHRDLIVGRAFLVFWPLEPGFPNRLGFIH